MSDFRRRLMRAIGKIGPEAPYPDPWEDDGKIWAYINITDTSSATTIGYSNITRYAGMEIDGISVTPTNTYQFSTTGEHLIKLDISRGMYAYTFTNTQTLLRCYFPDSVTNIPNDFFQSCRNLSFVHLPINVKIIGARIFSGCTNLIFKDLSLPYLTTLNTSCFQNVSIRKISDLGGITEIPGNYVFASNASLKSIVLPGSITQIGNYAFSECSSLKTITCKALTPPTLYTNVFRNVSPTAIYVPTCSLGAYKTASGWSNYASVIYPLDNGMVYFTIEWHDGETDIFELPENSTWADIVANPLYNHGLGKVTGRAYTFCESTLQEGYVGILDEYNNERLLAPDMSTTTGIDPDGALLTESINCGAYYTCVDAKEDIGEDGGEEA